MPLMSVIWQQFANMIMCLVNSRAFDKAILTYSLQELSRVIGRVKESYWKVPTYLQ